jgi:hypothetical protein
MCGSGRRTGGAVRHHLKRTKPLIPANHGICAIIISPQIVGVLF